MTNKDKVSIVTNNTIKEKFSIQNEIKKEDVQNVLKEINNSKTHLAEYKQNENKVVIREYLKD
jgi:ribosomal protein S15P/S13E